MGDEALSHRVPAVLDKQHPVELALYLRVGDASVVDVVLDVGVAGAVQGEMADEAHQVGLGRVAVIGLRDDVAGGSEEVPRRESVHVEPDLAGRVPVEGVVVEQDVRAVEADVVQLPVPLCYGAEVRIQPLDHLFSEPVVCVGGWHVQAPGMNPNDIIGHDDMTSVELHYIQLCIIRMGRRDTG